MEVIMPIFTIEATYRIPIYRQRSYEADTLAEACRLAIEDDDWEGQKEDYETAGETYVTGIWPGDVSPYSVPALPVPSHFGESLQRKAEHFEVLLGLAQIEVAPERQLDQAFEFRIAQRLPPAGQHCGVGAATRRREPALAHCNRGHDMLGADAGAAGQQGERESEHQAKGKSGWHGRPHWSLLRTNRVASIRVTAAMTAIGHALAKTSAGGSALRKLPCRMIR
jgi:hypothetical protein